MTKSAWWVVIAVWLAAFSPVAFEASEESGAGAPPAAVAQAPNAGSQSEPEPTPSPDAGREETGDSSYRFGWVVDPHG